MTDLITLKGLRGFGYHGVLEHERRDGQEFMVDVEVTTDFSVAAKTDQLDATLNYALIADLVFAKITGPAFNLIESLADSIGEQILNMPNVISVEVTVHKPFAPIEVEFDDVSVTRRLP
ncbi:MAG: dihydroneopterin aldolase [Actinobacteria bacterium]|jgi:dihydroneopterin aldolase|nr:dihydroneopterin aldolase [Actinomycetota bacterium]